VAAAAAQAVQVVAVPEHAAHVALQAWHAPADRNWPTGHDKADCVQAQLVTYDQPTRLLVRSQTE